MDLEEPQLPEAGEIIGSGYRLERVIGRGGMGVVVLATHVEREQEYAIKLLIPEALDLPELVLRFEREARAAMRIESPHVAKVFEVGRIDDRRTFMVMELLEGEDLRALLKRDDTPMPVEEAVRYLLEAMHAIGEAHAKGIVHRDLKPSNLFVAERADGDKIIKVLDFGISKLQDERLALTKTLDVIGTPFYMAPEQVIAAKYVDERADVWSLGVILYELLTARKPFEAPTMAGMVSLVRRASPTPLREIVAEIPEELERAVLRCLRAERDDRFDDVGELATALAPFTADGARLAEGVVAARDKANHPRADLLAESTASLAKNAVTKGGAKKADDTTEPMPGSSTTMPVVTSSVAPAPRRAWGVWVVIALVVLGFGYLIQQGCAQ